MSLRFEKYEGLGNDFMVVDAESETALDEQLAVKLCDRHFGVGADGVLWVLPPGSAKARVRMVVTNADGSRPEMCGNGLRCVALHLVRQDGVQHQSYLVDTDRGPLSCQVERTGDQARVSIEMGRGEAVGDHQQTFEGALLRFARISMGNPHAIVFDESYDEAAIDRLGLSNEKFKVYVEGELDPGVGMAYRREILEKGGAEDADVLLRSFLGREPSREAFLRNTGI